MTKVTVENGLVKIGSRRLPLIAGEIQFWRMDPETWEPAVRAARDAGVQIISTYLSWRRHAPTPGGLDLTGRRDPRLDVRRFLDVCADADVYVQLKPGPWICAEEVGGGYPDWLLDRRELLVRDDAGEIALGYNPPFQHPMPSYSHPGFLEAVDGWFTAIWAVVGDLVFPNGPVIAFQLDNEPSTCFQDSMYRSDYSDAAVEAYRKWLWERYDGSPQSWRTAWADETLTSFDQAEPPYRPVPGASAVARRLYDWIDFKTDTAVRYLAELKAIHHRLGGQDLLYTVNLVTHPVHDVPVAHAAVSREVGAATGEDHYYIPPLATDDIHRLARSAATARAAGEPLPWVPELQAGIWRSPGERIDYPDPTPLEQEIWWGAAVALGFNGFNLYMLSDRENWELAPLGIDGGRSPFFAPIDNLVASARRRPDALTAPVTPSVVVAWHRPDAKAAYTVTGTSRIPDVDWYDEDAAAAYCAWDTTLLQLTAAGLAYNLWDTATELTEPIGIPLVVPPRSGVDQEHLVLLRATGRRIIELTEPATTSQLNDLGPDSPAIISPAGRVPQTLVTARRTTDGHILHIVNWGSDRTDAVLRFPCAPDGILTHVPTGRATPFRSGCAAVHLTPGHQTLHLAG
ncbi:beta-galactosidase [Kribbella sp. NPDC055071]